MEKVEKVEKADNLNIVLVGMMGGGKSYIGDKLRKLLVHFNYIDTDKEIEARTGLTIPEIFDKHSERYFRKLEKELIKEVSKKKNQIISIGGGAFEKAENIEALKENGLTFYLKATPNELYERLSGVVDRPVLGPDFTVNKIEQILKKREKNYKKAHFIIDTNRKQAYTILNDILSEYESYDKQRTCC